MVWRAGRDFDALPARFMVPMRAKKGVGPTMEPAGSAAFPAAGLPDFRVRWTRNGRLESRPNPQARKPALRTRLGSWSQCARHMAWRLPMNRNAELQLGAVWRAPNAPTWRSALQARGSWSQCAPELA